MSNAIAIGAVLALLAWCALAGRALLQLVSALPAQTERRVALSVVAGLLAGHLVLAVHDAIGVPWSRGSLLLAGGALLSLLWRPLLESFARRPAGRGAEPIPQDARRAGPSLDVPSADVPSAGVPSTGAPSTDGVDWADLVAILAVGACAASSLALRSPFSDFVYHWGLKAHRFFLAHGTDLEFLARPENVYLHPDYPNLMPGTFAVASLLAGRFEPRALMVLTPAFLLLLLALARAALRESTLPPFARRLVFAGLACALGAFCVGYFQGGSADVPFALAVLIAACALIGPIDRAAAAQLAIAAAFACALKLEGLPLAALAIGLWLARAALARAPTVRSPTTWAVLILPVLVTGGAWAIQVLSLDLLREGGGGFELSRVGVVVRNLWRQSLLEEWLGLPLLLLAAPPLAALSPRVRWLGLLVAAQLAFYLWVYLSSPGDAAFYVLSTWPRLALHLLPATVVGVALALAPEETEIARG
jgi:hypothetical protein